jgi:UDP-glucose 4-epimerase
MSESRLPAEDSSHRADSADAESQRRPTDVLVVGGAGFIGSHFVDRLVAERATVEVVDDLSTGSLANLAEARAAAPHSGGEVHIHTLDATSPDLATLITLRRPRQVVHLALLVPATTSVVDLGNSFTSMLGVVDACRAASVEKIIVALPATVLYGTPSARQLPAKEGEITPRGVRGVIAGAIVDLLTTYRQDHGIEFTALAVTTVYGPRQQPQRGAVARLLDAAANGEPARLTGDGRQTRDFVHVDDVVDAVARTRNRGSGLVINVGTGVQTSLRELVAMIGSDVPPSFVAERPGELGRFCVSPVRARIHLGWAPWTTLADGVSALRNAP